MQVVVDTILTHYEVFGEKNKRTVVILHGWKQSLIEWLTIVKDLSDKYHVVLVDLPGFGMTPRPKQTFDIFDYAKFVENFLHKLEINNVTLIGHSFGGRIGIILGAQTDSVEKLILIDSAAIEKRTLMQQIKLLRNKVLAYPLSLLLSQQSINKLKRSIGSEDYRTAGQMRDIFVKIVNQDLTHLLPKIHVPTTIIWGEKDTELPLSMAKMLKQLIPDARLRIAWNTGHNPHLEKSSELLVILKDSL